MQKTIGIGVACDTGRDDAALRLEDPRCLIGAWDFFRTIDDRFSGRRSRARGTARFGFQRVPDPEPDRARSRALPGAETGADTVWADILWEEHGTLDWEARTIEVMRTLRIRRADSGSAGRSGTGGSPAEDPGGWDVLFEDGSFFHPWRVAERVDHPCSDDLYAGLLTPLVPSGAGRSWSMEWSVRGPAKDYTLRTVYARE